MLYLKYTQLLVCLAWTIRAEAGCLATPVSVRLPPTLSGEADDDWKPPPVGWDFGNWYQTNSSSANTFQRNLQWSTFPLDPTDPTGKRSDLSSFQLVGNDTVLTSYGEDTPTETPAVYYYQGTGILQEANDYLQILAWGTDCHGIGYRLSYSTFTEFTQTPASVDILSRTAKGPDARTLGKIQEKLIAFGVDEITKLTKAMVPALQDGARDGQPPILTCDEHCKSNEDLLDLIGSG